MRKLILLITITAAFCGCNKELIGDGGKPIELVVKDLDLSFEETKATALTAVPGTLYWGANYQSGGSWVQKYANTSSTVSAGKISTGKYQTATATTYRWFLSNASITLPAGTITIDNKTDYIAGYASSSSATPSITMEHCFARTGTLSLKAKAGHSYADANISNVSWTIVGSSAINGTAGTYRISDNTWTAASTKLTSATAMTSSSDMYLIPGTYTVSVTFTITKGEYSNSFTKSQDITLTRGYINNIKATLDMDDPYNEIILSVSLTDWKSKDIDIVIN